MKPKNMAGADVLWAGIILRGTAISAATNGGRRKIYKDLRKKNRLWGRFFGSPHCCIDKLQECSIVIATHWRSAGDYEH